MEKLTTIRVEKLLDAFHMKQIVGDKLSLQRKISIADINRPGLELAGFYQFSQKKRIVIFGDKEIEYIKTLSTYRQRKSFDFITSEETPLLILSKSHECPPILKRMAKRKNFPILSSHLDTYRLIIDLTTFLDEELAVSESLHGGLVSVFGRGILIRGESGLGKSEIALELIKRGHLMVADDRVDCYNVHNQIIGKPAQLLEGLLEIRGVGVIDVQRMFGVSSVTKSKKVDLVIQLETWDKEKNYNRLGIENIVYYPILGVDIPIITIPVREGRSMAVIIEAAVTNFILQQQGLNSAKEFEQRVLNFIQNEQEED